MKIKRNFHSLFPLLFFFSGCFFRFHIRDTFFPYNRREFSSKWRWKLAETQRFYFSLFSFYDFFTVKIFFRVHEIMEKFQPENFSLFSYSLGTYRNVTFLDDFIEFYCLNREIPKTFCVKKINKLSILKMNR